MDEITWRSRNIQVRLHRILFFRPTIKIFEQFLLHLGVERLSTEFHCSRHLFFYIVKFFKTIWDTFMNYYLIPFLPWHIS